MYFTDVWGKMWHVYKNIYWRQNELAERDGPIAKWIDLKDEDYGSTKISKLFLIASKNSKRKNKIWYYIPNVPY